MKVTLGTEPHLELNATDEIVFIVLIFSAGLPARPRRPRPRARTDQGAAKIFSKIYIYIFL